MWNIAVVTATRAEYGLLYPLIREINSSPDMNLVLIVTGTHLSEKYGFTVNEIEKDEIPISARIPILAAGNDKRDISQTIANAITGFAEYFSNNSIDFLVILGDRTEMLGVACAAMNELIPIAHISGGGVTEGAIDDCIRHCLTKMSYLHFTTTERYRKRVIQMGESPERVINAGSLAVDNIVRYPLLSEKQIREFIGIEKSRTYAVVTFHPITRDSDSGLKQIYELCHAMNLMEDVFFLITGSNADVGGIKVNDILRQFVDDSNHALFVDSLGKTRYLSAVKYAAFVLGNSSSGITEAPILGTPTVNIGDRQRGRIIPDTVFNCSSDSLCILNCMKKALASKHKKTDLFGLGNTASTIVSAIRNNLEKGVNIKKSFFDIDYTL